MNYWLSGFQLWTAMLCVVAAGLMDAAWSAEWPMFHGPQRDNLAPETGLLKSWPKDGPRLFWKSAECGKGYATVSIAGGLIFTSGDFGDQECVIALDMQGRRRWKTVNGQAWKGAQPGARTVPAFSEGMVYHLGPHGDLLALEAATGRKVWTVNLKDIFEAPLGVWGYTENLLVDGDRILCMPGGLKGRVVALDKKTGQTLWANTDIPDRAGYSSPIIAEHGGVRQFITLARSTVFGVDIQTGKLLWLHKHEGFCDQNVTSPIYHDGRVFVTSGHKAGGRVVKISADNRLATQVWFGTRLDNCHGGVVLLDGYLYGCGCRMYNKGLLCVDFYSGEVKYLAADIGKASLTYADGMLYCLDNDGSALLVKPTPKSAEVVSRFKLLRADEAHTLSHPVVCDGKLYLRHHENLWVYAVKDQTGL